jgi:hypothetical protein
MSDNLDSSAIQLDALTEDQFHRARLMTCLAATDVDEALVLLDMLGLAPVACKVGHGIRKPWCLPCRKKWPERNALTSADAEVS